MENKSKKRETHLPSPEGPLRMAFEQTMAPYIRALFIQEEVSLEQSKIMISGLIKKLRDLSLAFDKEKYRPNANINKIKVEELIKFILDFKDYEEKIIYWERVAEIMKKHDDLFPKEKSVE